MMRLSANGIALTESFERCKLQEYPDGSGHPTIGIGHKILKGETFDLQSRQDAVTLLMSDMEPVEHCINTYVTVDINQNQFDALCDFTFNEGQGALRGSTLLRLLNQSDYQGAADQFLVWDKEHVDGQLVESDGLLRRRTSERTLFLT